jgi:hypothetical protein
MKFRGLVISLSLLVFFLQILEPTSNFVRTIAQPDDAWKAAATAELLTASVPAESIPAPKPHERGNNKDHEEQEAPTAAHAHSALPFSLLIFAEPSSDRRRRLIWDMTYLNNFPHLVYYPPRAA